jgi:vanillate O-demethylase ferredoxin subunit
LINPSMAEVTPETYEIVIQREANGRGGSAWLFDNLTVDTWVDIEGPYQSFAMQDGPGPVLLVAGGIGVTPILSMARTCDKQGRAYELHYFARTPDAAPLLGAIRRLQGKQIHLHFDVPVREVTDRLREILFVSPSTRKDLYVCGPQGLIDASLESARALGWVEEQLHFERFAPIETPSDRPFRVKLMRTGTTVEVSARQSMLQALSASGVQIASSCGAGICGSCLVTVVDGQVDHRDGFLSAEEKQNNDMMCVCVSRALGPELAVDL